MAYDNLLTKQLASRADVQALSDDELVVMLSKHDEEITSVEHRIESLGDKASPAITTVLKFLRIHRRWIREEKKQRGKEKRKATAHEQMLAAERKREQKRLAAEAHERAVREAAEAKAVRMASLQAFDRKQIAVFKMVVREVLGDEMYMHLWKLTQDRLLEAA